MNRKTLARANHFVYGQSTKPDHGAALHEAIRRVNESESNRLTRERIKK